MIYLCIQSTNTPNFTALACIVSEIQDFKPNSREFKNYLKTRLYLGIRQISIPNFIALAFIVSEIQTEWEIILEACQKKIIFIFHYATLKIRNYISG